MNESTATMINLEVRQNEDVLFPDTTSTNDEARRFLARDLEAVSNADLRTTSEHWSALAEGMTLWRRVEA